jgi:lipopolysaccharide exporter
VIKKIYALKTYIIQSEPLKNILYLLTGSGLSQIIPILSMPFLSRVYTHFDFALFSFILSCNSPLSTISSGKYDMTIVLAKNEKEALNILYLSYITCIILAILISILTWVSKEWVSIAFNVQDFKNIWYFIPLFFILQGLFSTNLFWLQRQKKFKLISKNKVIQMSAISIVSAIIGKWNIINNGLCWGYLIGWAIITFVSLFQVIYIIEKPFDLNIKLIKEAAIKFKKFPLYNMFPSLLNNLTISIPIFIVLNQFSENEVGLFSFIRPIIMLPISILTGTLSQVYFQRISQAVREGNTIKKEYNVIITVLLITSIFYISFVVIYGNDLIIFAFGEKWAKSSSYAKIIVVGVGFQLIVLPLFNILLALEKVIIISIWQTLYFLIMLSMFFFKYNDINQFLKFSVLVESICFVVLFIAIYQSLSNFEKNKQNSDN